MRTKALLLGAIIGAASLASSMAQVYSVNIVGYINVPIPAGFTLIANQLNNSAGNALETLIPASPTAISVYKWNTTTAAFDIANWDTDFQQWDNTFTLSPGEGFWVFNGGTPWTLTLVGEVMTGQQTVNFLAGFNLVSSIVPQEGLLQTQLGYVPSSTGDTIFTYVNGAFGIFNYDADFQMWDEEPTIHVGEGFFAQRTQPGAWTRTFNVN
jgi:hypothetical protein